MNKGQPGVVLRFEAKPGNGDELFKLVTDLHYTGDPDGPVDWVLSRDAGDPDVILFDEHVPVRRRHIYAVRLDRFVIVCVCRRDRPSATRCVK